MVELEHLPWQIMVGRLLMAAAAGAMVGQERERREHAAGFRTHLLVSAGACLFMLISTAVAGDIFDPGRVSAGIITGIGFLGAGTIIRHGGSVHGLTTAASLWAVAGVGMAAGIGWWEAVIAATILLYLSLTCLKWAEGKLLHGKQTVCLQIEIDERKLSLPLLRREFVALGHEPSSVELTYDDDKSASLAIVHLDDLSPSHAADVVDHVAKIDGVRSVRTM